MEEHMYIRRISALTLLPLILILFWGCGGDDSPPTGQTGSVPAPYPTAISAPTTAMSYSGDSLAGLTSAFLTLGKKLDTLFDPTRYSSDTTYQSEGNSVYEYARWRGSLNVKMIRVEETSGYKWTVAYYGQESGWNFNNWIFIQAEQSYDGHSGHMYQYAENTSVALYEWEWAYENNLPTMNLQWAEGENACRFRAIINSGTTGSAEYYLNGVIQWKVEWSGTNSNVSGMWHQYYEGSLWRSGSWFFST
jgi:hypothetical protein